MKQVDQLHGFLLTDMTKAVAHLDQVLKALDAYASVWRPARNPVPPPAEPETEAHK